MKKIILLLAAMALVTASFTGCNDNTEGANSSKTSNSSNSGTTTKKSSDNSEAETEATEKEEEVTVPEGGYKLPEIPELIIFQNGKELFRYNGETLEEVRATLVADGAIKTSDTKYELVPDLASIVVDSEFERLFVEITCKDGVTATVDGVIFERSTESYKEMVSLYGSQEWIMSELKAADVHAVTNQSSQVVLGFYMNYNLKKLNKTN